MYSTSFERQRQIIIDGNSLSNQAASLLVGGMRYPIQLYSSIVAGGYSFVFQNYSVGGKQTHVLVTDYPTKIAPRIHTGDILIMWEITNDLGVGAQGMRTAAQAIQDLADYTAVVRANTTGVKLVYLTMIARDGSSDPADLENSRLTVNTELVNNTSTYCDLLIDVGALTQFDSQADCANTTYYHADKIHLTTTGYDLIATTVFNTLSAANYL